MKGLPCAFSILLATVLLATVGCGGGGGGAPAPGEPPFDIHTAYASVYGNYRIGTKTNLISFTTGAVPGVLSGVIQDAGLESYLIIGSRITTTLTATVEQAAFDADGNPATTEDAQALSLTDGADTIVFSQDGIDVTLDFGVLAGDETLSYGFKGSLRSTTTTLPRPPG